MADKIRKVGYYYTMVSNRPGAAAKILGMLRAAGVNLLAISGFPAGRQAQLDFVPEEGGAFLSAMRKAGFKLSKRKLGFLVEGGDRIGACAAVLDRLARAKINVTAIDAVSAGKGRFGAILWVKRRDVARAAKALHAR